jgi:hypothetical protein
MDILELIKGDENLVDSLGEHYAGDGATYADRLAAANSVSDALEIMTNAAFIARVSGDYCGSSDICDAYATYRAML